MVIAIETNDIQYYDSNQLILFQAALLSLRSR
jgi:hypothetical protein